jgi:hypothetical protein
MGNRVQGSGFSISGQQTGGRGLEPFFARLYVRVGSKLQFLRKQLKAANLRNKKVGLRSQIHEVEGKLNDF